MAFENPAATQVTELCENAPYRPEALAAYLRDQRVYSDHPAVEGQARPEFELLP